MARKNIATSTIAGTIAFRNTDLANKFLIEAGFGPSRHPEEIAYKLNNYIINYGEAAIEGLAEIHPDRDQILATIKKNNEPAEQTQNLGANGFDNFYGNHFNCNGQNCNCKKNNPANFNATGDEINSLKSINILDQKSIMMIGLFCITAISIVALTRKGN
jgi:hypothetical protein